MADEDFDEDTALHQRFKSLIQPIKDLAANWDVDIAESLNDYLDELSRLAFTVDESDDEGDENEMNVDDNQLRKKKTTKKLNFAEAALLIQGSTNIYSKKVEYLYQLVLKSLEVITHRKSTILRNSNEEEDEQGEGGDGAIVIGKINRNKNVNKLQELDLYDFTCDDPKYLLLDDYIEEGKNIDLPNKESILKQYDIPTTRSRLSLDRSLQNISHISNVSNASIALMTSFLQQDLGKNEFRLTTSFINADGSLFIPGMDPVNGHDHNNQSIILPSTTKKKNLNVSFHQEGEDNQKDGAVAMDVVANDDYFPVATDDDYGYSDRLSQEHYTSPLRDPAVDKQIENVPVTASDNIPPPSSSTANAIEKEDDAALDLENVNFPMHDPHEVLPGSKPFRKGKCYRTPKAPSLTQEEKFHLMMYGCLPDETPPTFKTVDDVDVTQILVSFDPQAPVMFTALQPLYELKLKLDKRRTRLEQLAARKASRQAGVQEGEDVENGGAEEEILHNLYETGNRSKNEVDLADIPPELQYIYAPAGDEDELGEMNGDDNPYIDNGGDAYFDGEERAGRDVNEPDNGLYFFDTNEEEELTKRVEAALEDSIVQTQGGGSSYQSMIKQYLEGFGASSYQRESQLVQRVNEWTTRIEPILAAQEEVKPFDIYEYSDEVLTTANHILLEKKKRKEKLKQENQDELYKEKQDEGHEEDIKFSEIVTGKSTSEICRLFLSCLQLANQGNLEIMTDQQDQSNSNNAVLTALTQPLNTMEDKKTRRGQRNQKVSAATVMMTQDLTHLAAGAKPLPEGSVGNDLTFRLHSVQRSKDIEEFRAPSLVTHPIGRQQPRSKENIPI